MTKKRTNDRSNIISFVPDAPFYYERANRALQKEDRGRAKRYFERAYELDATDIEGLIDYSLFLIEEGRFTEAYECLSKARTLDPLYDEITYYLAEVHAHLGLLVEAKQYAEQYIEESGEGEFTEEAEAIIEFADQEGVSLLDEEFTGEIFFMQEKAQRKMEEGDFEGAANIFEDLVVDYPDLLAASNNLALSYFYTNRLDEAKDLLRDVLEEDPGNVHALCNLAVFTYYERRQLLLKELIQVLKKIYPIPLEHQFKIGATFGLIGEYNESYERLRRLERYGYRDDVGFYFWLSQAAYYSGRIDEAKRAHEKLIELDPSKDGTEPWSEIEEKEGFEHDYEHLVEQLTTPLPSRRLYGLFLLGKTIHQQALISHAHYIQIDTLLPIEQLFFVYAIDPDFVESHDGDDPQLRSIQVAELLYEQHAPLDERGDKILRQWFAFSILAYGFNYEFFNPEAIAAAFDYNQRQQNEKVTKKEIAEIYGISVPTLSKYLKELFAIYPSR